MVVVAMKVSLPERGALQRLVMYSRLGQVWSVEVGALECFALQLSMGRGWEIGNCCLHLDRMCLESVY